MNKSKNSIEKIGKYLRELSVVVIGVAITLSASYWISNKNEKKDMSLYLNTIKLELAENKNTLDETVKRSQGSVKYADYLRSHDKKLLNPDTIKSYNSYFYDASSITIKTNAFEMFRTSGNMRLIEDKELLLSIWNAYTNLLELKQRVDQGMQIKLDELMKEAELYSLYDFHSFSDEEILNNVPMYNFYTRTSFAYLLPQICEKCSRQISETISKLE